MAEPSGAPATAQRGAIRLGAWGQHRRALALLRLCLLGVAAVALVAVLVARLLAAQHVVQQATQQPTLPAADATGLAAVQRGVPFGAQAGDAAPDFALTTWSWPGAPSQAGQIIRLAALRGQPVVLNFWASWCTACREEAPAFEAAWQHYRAQGVVFLGIAVQDNDADSVHFIHQYGITYLNGADATDTIPIAYGVPGLPTTVFIDRTGRIASTHIGLIDAGTLDLGIQAILA